MTVPTGVRLREAGPGDAAALLALKRSLDLETSFMLLEPDELTDDEHDIAADLAAKVAAGNSVVMLAEAGLSATRKRGAAGSAAARPPRTS